MEISQEGLAVLLLVSVAAGYLFGLIYDLFGFIPKVFKSNKVAVFIYDFLFCSAAGVFLCLLIYRFNDGKFRVAVPIGVISGILIYKFTLRKYILRLSCRIALLILKVIGVIIKPTVKIRDALAKRKNERKAKKEEKNDKKKSRNSDIGISPHGCSCSVCGELDAVQQNKKRRRRLQSKTLGT